MVVCVSNNRHTVVARIVSPYYYYSYLFILLDKLGNGSQRWLEIFAQFQRILNPTIGRQDEFIFFPPKIHLLFQLFQVVWKTGEYLCLKRLCYYGVSNVKILLRHSITTTSQ